MTDFNNLNSNENVKNIGEEENFSSPVGILEENANFMSNGVNSNQNFNQFNVIPPVKTMTESVGEDELIKRQAYNPMFNKNLDPEIFAEKNKIKTDSRTIGAAFLVMFGIILLLNIIVLIVNQILIFGGEYKAFEILNSAVVMQVLEIMFSLLAFTTPFILIYRLSAIRISDLMCFSLPKLKIGIPFFFFGIAFCSFANIVSAIASSLFETTNISYNVPELEQPTGIYGFLLALISTVIVPAFVEEFACRGLMLGLLKKHGEAFAIIASSLLFGLMHGNFEQIPFAFFVGLVLGFITVKSGTITIAIAVHAFNNFVSVAFDYIFNDFPIIYQNIGYMIFLIICLALGIFAIFLLNGNDKDLYTFKPSKTKASEGKKLVWFFTASPILIYTALCLIESFSFFFI